MDYLKDCIMKRIILIVGMHRSGTSVVSRCMQVFNISLGDNLMPPDDYNPKGFYEDLDIYQLNEKILEYIGQHWDTPEVIPPSIFNDIYTVFSTEGRSIIKKKMSNVSTYSFKDPRTSILLPFWKKVLITLTIDFQYIFVYRNPLSVIDSLSKRDSFDIQKTIQLWLKYNQSILTHTDPLKTLCVNYDDVIHNTREQILRMSTFLNLKPNTHKVSLLCNHFIDDTLRNSLYRPEDFLYNSGYDKTARDVYRNILKFHNQ